MVSPDICSAPDVYVALKRLAAAFDFSRPAVQTFVGRFHDAMEHGLQGKESPLKMIPTFIGPVIGEYPGYSYIVDFGGTHIRIMLVEIAREGRIDPIEKEERELTDRELTGTTRVLFDAIAGELDCLISRLLQKGYRSDELAGIPVGFTFSYPTYQTALAHGRVAALAKNLKIADLPGKDPAAELEAALKRMAGRSVTNTLKITALLNDTSATAVYGQAIAAQTGGYPCATAGIIGTGSNFCTIIHREKIRKISAESDMIVNLESGAFHGTVLPRTPYDELVDRCSSNRGEQLLEKMISGAYLGAISAAIIGDFIESGLLDCQSTEGTVKSLTGCLTSRDCSEIEKDQTNDRRKVREVLQKLGFSGSSASDGMHVQRICSIVSTRAARLAAAVIGAVTLSPLSLAHTIPRQTVYIDGSVFEKYWQFSERMEQALCDMTGPDRTIRLQAAKDASGKGAALVARMAAHGFDPRAT